MDGGSGPTGVSLAVEGGENDNGGDDLRDGVDPSTASMDNLYNSSRSRISPRARRLSAVLARASASTTGDTAQSLPEPMFPTSDPQGIRPRGTAEAQGNDSNSNSNNHYFFNETSTRAKRDTQRKAATDADAALVEQLRAPHRPRPWYRNPSNWLRLRMIGVPVSTLALVLFGVVVVLLLVITLPYAVLLVLIGALTSRFLGLVVEHLYMLPIGRHHVTLARWAMRNWYGLRWHSRFVDLRCDLLQEREDEYRPGSVDVAASIAAAAAAQAASQANSSARERANNIARAVANAAQAGGMGAHGGVSEATGTGTANGSGGGGVGGGVDVQVRGGLAEAGCPISIHAIPFLTDNVMYLVVDRSSFRKQGFFSACVVDVGDALALADSLGEIARIHYDGRPVRLEAVLTTHKHWDHQAGNIKVQRLFPSIRHVYGSQVDRVLGCTDPVVDGDTIAVAGIRWRVLAAPSHTRGSLMFLLRGVDGRDAVMTGDTLFHGGFGACFEGSEDEMKRNAATLLEHCSRDALLFPGHEYSEQLLSEQLLQSSWTRQAHTHPPSDFFRFAAVFYNATHRRSLRSADRLMAIPTSIAEELVVNPNMRSLVVAAKRVRAVIKAASRFVGRPQHDHPGFSGDQRNIDSSGDARVDNVDDDDDGGGGGGGGGGEGGGQADDDMPVVKAVAQRQRESQFQRSSDSLVDEMTARAVHESDINCNNWSSSNILFNNNHPTTHHRHLSRVSGRADKTRRSQSARRMARGRGEESPTRRNNRGTPRSVWAVRHRHVKEPFVTFLRADVDRLQAQLEGGKLDTHEAAAALTACALRMERPLDTSGFDFQELQDVTDSRSSSLQLRKRRSSKKSLNKQNRHSTIVLDDLDPALTAAAGDHSDGVEASGALGTNNTTTNNKNDTGRDADADEGEDVYNAHVCWLSTLDFEKLAQALVLVAMPAHESKWLPETSDDSVTKLSRSRLEVVLERACCRSPHDVRELVQELEALWPSRFAFESLSVNRALYFLTGRPSSEDVVKVAAAITPLARNQQELERAQEDDDGATAKPTHRPLVSMAHHEHLARGQTHQQHDRLHDLEAGAADVADVSCVSALCAACCCLCCSGPLSNDLFPSALHDIHKCPLCTEQFGSPADHVGDVGPDRFGLGSRDNNNNTNDDDDEEDVQPFDASEDVEQQQQQQQQQPSSHQDEPEEGNDQTAAAAAEEEEEEEEEAVDSAQSTIYEDGSSEPSEGPGHPVAPETHTM